MILARSLRKTLVAHQRGLSMAVRHWSSSLVPSLLLPPTSRPWSRSLQIDHESYQNKLTVIIQRLKKHLSSRKWPKLKHLNFAGKRFGLPISSKDIHVEVARLGEVHVAYLAGFFDGDGCVCPYSNSSGIALDVEQSVSNSSVLFLFLVNFGGSIRCSKSGMGSARTTLKWGVYGTQARAAAGRLHAHCLVKKEQLRIATAWPSSTSDRESCGARLAQLKRLPPSVAPHTVTSWHYVAGFFDAEGCLSVDSKTRSVTLSLSQRDPEILQGIRTFIAMELPEAKTRLHADRLETPSGYRLCSSTTTTFMILKKLLESGLEFKRAQALHLMTSNHLLHAAMRESVGLAKGNQSCFRRLDEDGCERARQIVTIRQQLSQQTCHMAASEKLQEELEVAKLEHCILNSQSQIWKLRSFITSIRRMHEEEKGLHHLISFAS